MRRGCRSPLWRALKPGNITVSRNKNVPCCAEIPRLGKKATNGYKTESEANDSQIIYKLFFFFKFDAGKEYTEWFII